MLADSIWHGELNAKVREARGEFRNHKLEKLGKCINKIIPAIIQCYQGKHNLCCNYSLVCNGMNPRYMYLPKFACGNFRFTSDDVRMLNTVC